jgi:hypothetical protein
MATLPKPPVPAPKTVPVAPTAEAWQAMSEPARLRLLLEVIDALSDPAITMSEGRPHKKAKSRAADKLGLYFGSTPRSASRWPRHRLETWPGRWTTSWRRSPLSSARYPRKA